MPTTEDAPRADLGLANTATSGPERYADALRETLARLRPDLLVTAVGEFASPSEGLSNETVLFTATVDDRSGTRAARFVARIQAEGKPLAPPQTPRCSSPVEFEYWLQGAVASSGSCPVAPVVGFEPDPAVLGRPFYVMEQVAGRVPGVNPSFHLEGFMKDEATPEQRRHLVDTTLRALARLHAVDWRTTSLPRLFEGVVDEPDLEYQLGVYRRDFDEELAGRDFDEELAGRDFPLIDNTFTWLRDRDPGRHHIGLVWGDTRLGNVIVEERYEPAAFLDWENGFVGPCEADIGWWAMSDRVNHDLLGIDRLPGYPDLPEHLAVYADAAGAPIENLRYWEVFAAMRAAHGMLRLAGRMDEMGMLPPEMAHLGFDNPITQVLTGLLDG